MKTIVFFAGSQEILDENIKNDLENDLDVFFSKNKNNILKVIFGAWSVGVMGIIFRACKKYDIKILGYSVERYKKEEDGNGVEIIYHKTDLERFEHFMNDGDIFVALPGGFGTIKEILGAKDFILEKNLQKNLYVSKKFEGFYNLINNLKNIGMIYPKDFEFIKTVENLEEINF